MLPGSQSRHCHPPRPCHALCTATPPCSWAPHPLPTSPSPRPPLAPPRHPLLHPAPSTRAYHNTERACSSPLVSLLPVVFLVFCSAVCSLLVFLCNCVFRWRHPGGAWGRHLRLGRPLRSRSAASAIVAHALTAATAGAPCMQAVLMLTRLHPPCYTSTSLSSCGRARCSAIQSRMPACPCTHRGPAVACTSAAERHLGGTEPGL